MICPYCKKEIVPVEESTSSVSVVNDEDGRVSVWAEEIRDSDSVLIGKRVDEYIYHRNGVIDTICQQVYDKGVLVYNVILRHNIQGKDVVVENLM